MIPWKFFFLTVHFSKIMKMLPIKKQKLDRRKLQDFKDGLNSPKDIQVYEVSM